MALEMKQEIQFKDEILFGEYLQTFDYRIPVIGCRPTYQSGRSTDRSLQSRFGVTRPGYQMPRSGGSFEIYYYLSGAMVDTATGGLVSTWQQKLLGDGMGGSDLTQIGGVAGAGASAISVPASTGTGLRGGMRRYGQLRDARALGQAAVNGNPVTSLLTALPGVPSATDVVRACQMVWLAEALGASKRFLLGFSDNPGAQYVFHGCQLANRTIRTIFGDLSVVTDTYSYANWREVTGFTVPSASALLDCKPWVAAGGSNFLQLMGTATRLTVDAAEMEFSFNIGLIAQLGQTTTSNLQNIIGWARTHGDGPLATLRLAVPEDIARTLAFDADGSDSIFYHFLATLSAGEGVAVNEGRHCAMYAPQMYFIGQRPAVRSWNGLQYMDLFFGLTEGPDTTTELSRSAWRMGIS